MADQTDAQTRYQVMLDVIDYYETIFKNRKRSVRPKESTEEAKICSVLDIGCGLGHLHDYSKKF